MQCKIQADMVGRLRGDLPAFSARRMRALRERADLLVSELLDGIAALTPPADLPEHGENAWPGRSLPVWNEGMGDDYRAVNRARWDERAPAHAASPGYGVARFGDDPSHLSDVVRFDLPLLGDVSGLRGIHLQCHIGTDTISLTRLGARMTGLDFSPAAIAEARRIAALAGADVRFIEADVYDAAGVAGRGAFDLVFTGIGALCWLPDVRRWAQVAADLLRPGGRLFMREGHPMLWALDDARDDGLLVLEYPYFEREEPGIWDEGGTYVETDAVFEHNLSHEWNHGLGEIVTAVIDAGMHVTGLVEHDSVPWEALPGQMEQIGSEWRVAQRPWRLAHSYTLQAIKRSWDTP